MCFVALKGIFLEITLKFYTRQRNKHKYIKKKTLRKQVFRLYFVIYEVMRGRERQRVRQREIEKEHDFVYITIVFFKVFFLYLQLQLVM